MGECVHCGGSGVLNIVFSAWWTEWEGGVSTDPYATSCHCEMGQVMAEAGIDA